MAAASTGLGDDISLAHLIGSNFYGGPEKQIVELSRRLQADGWRVAVGSFRENRDRVEIVDQAAKFGLPTYLLDTRNPFHPAAVNQLRSELRERSVQLLVTHGYKANLIGRLATRASSVRQLPIVRGYTAEDWKVRIYEGIDRRVLHGFPKLAAVSAATREMLVRHGLRRDRIAVLHNAVDCEQTVEPLDLRREFALSPQSIVIVAAGRLSPEKGHRHLLSAMAKVVEREPRAVTVILGAGSLQAALEKQIGELRLESHVILAGFRRDVLACLAGADLVVNPSLSEGLPNVVLEALSMRTAVVATDVGGVAELIESGRSGWLVASNDPQALASAILDALSDPMQRARVAAAGRARAESEFSFLQQRERFVELCRRVLEST